MTTFFNPGMSIREWPQQIPSGKLYLSSDQLNLVSGAATDVELDTIADGFTDGVEDTVNHRITPGVAGFYDLKGMVTFKNVVADKSYYTIIKHSVSGTLVTVKGHASRSEDLSVPATVHVYLPADGYLTLQAISYAVVDTVDINSGERQTFLSIQRVR